MRNATPISSQMFSAPSTAASGINASSAMRPRSAAIINGRRRRRSASTPACNPSSTAGSFPAAASSPIWPGVACRVNAALSGSASPDTLLPSAETVCPAHSRMKSGCRHRLPGRGARAARRARQSDVHASGNAKSARRNSSMLDGSGAPAVRR